MVTLSVALVHAPEPIVVRVSVKPPLIISAALGVYSADGSWLLGLKKPMPPLHITPDALVNEPFKETTGLLAQEVKFAPALTVGFLSKEITTSSDSAKQFPLAMVVRVSVTLPLAISAAVGL